MADGIEIQISGLTEIQEQLRQLPGNISRRVVISSLRAGASVVRKQIQATAPVRPGGIKTLKKGFRISRSRIHRTQTDQGVYLTLKKGGGRSDPKDPFYGKFQEDGFTAGVRHKYKEAFRLRNGRFEGYKKKVAKIRNGIFIEGKHFIQKAFEAKKNEAVAVIVSTAEAKIEQLTRNIGH